MISNTVINPASAMTPAYALIPTPAVQDASTGPRMPPHSPPMDPAATPDLARRSLRSDPSAVVASAAQLRPQSMTRSELAPVIRLTAEDGASAALDLALSIEQHWKSIAAMKTAEAAAVPARSDVIRQITETARESDPSDLIGMTLFGAPRSYGELWDDRITNTIDVAKSLAAYHRRGVIGTVFGYQLDEHMVALLAMDATLPVVRFACSHPGTQNAAGALLQSAVRYSASCGWHGELALYSYEDAMPAYEALGFVRNHERAKQLLKTTRGSAFDDQYMMLSPADSDKWCQVDGAWTLKSNLQQRFITALGSTAEPGVGPSGM